MNKPDRLAAALNGPRHYPPLTPAFASRLSFRRLRRPTTLPRLGDRGPIERLLEWVRS